MKKIFLLLLFFAISTIYTISLFAQHVEKHNNSEVGNLLGVYISSDKVSPLLTEEVTLLKKDRVKYSRSYGGCKVGEPKYPIQGTYLINGNEIIMNFKNIKQHATNEIRERMSIKKYIDKIDGRFVLFSEKGYLEWKEHNKIDLPNVLFHEDDKQKNTR